MKIHPYASVFPLMSGEEYDNLKADIIKNGLIEPIAIFDNQIIDGRNRYNACCEVNEPLRFFEWEDSGNLLDYVIAKNLHRRHLSASQRAMLATEFLPQLEKEALERKVLAGSNTHAKKHDLEEYIIEDKGKSTEKIADQLKVNFVYVSDAKRIKQTDSEVANLVKQGDLNIPQAKDIIKLPTELKDNLLIEIKEEDKGTVDKLITKYRNKAKTIKLGEISNKNIDLNTSKSYNLIYADPPWQYDNNRSPGSAENHYPTMSQDELIKLPINEIAAKDCVLFLWTTSPMLADACELIKVWGFKQKSSCIWQKSNKFENKFRGFYFRIVHEILLVATKGDIPPPEVESRVMSIQYHLPLEHSKKPDLFYEIIEKMYPTLPRIELFARSNRNGWDGWGNQV